MLEARNLCKQFGSQIALDDVSFRVDPGEIFCLLGANGAGKSTLINVFLNFLEPTSGTALIDGINVSEDPISSKRVVAYIPEQVMLYGVLSGIENLDYFASLGTGSKLGREALLALLARAGFDAAAADRRVSTYSKGMRQKVGIAIAFAKGAKALLLDEPTSGLDPKAANDFSSLLRQARDQGVAILTTTHDLFHARQTGTRIGIMRQGQLLQTFDAGSLTHNELEALYLAHMSA